LEQAANARTSSVWRLESVQLTLRDESLIDRIKWATLARVVLLTAVLAFAAVMDLGLGPQPASQVPETILYQLTTAFYLLSFLSLVGAHLWRNTEHLLTLAVASISIDVCLALALVATTDGIQSLFLFGFPLAVFNAALVLYRAGALGAATLCSVGLLLLAGVELHWLPWSLSPLRVEYLRTMLPHPPMRPTDVAVQVLVQLAAVYGTAFLSSHLVLELGKARLRAQNQRNEIKRLQVRYAAVITSLPDGLLTLAAGGIVSSVNLAGQEILELRPEQVHGLPLQSVIPELVASVAGEWEIQRKTRSPQGKEVTQILACRVVPLRDQRDGEGWLVVFRDMTEMRLREEIHRTRERLAAIGEMATAVAHEIRNPLASISGAVQMLEASAALGQENRQLMQIVLRETGQLSNWIGEFLDFARPRPLQWATVDLRQIVADTLQALKQDPRIAQNNIELRSDVGLDSVPSTAREFELQGDAMLLRQVVWNLLINGMQAVISEDKRIVAVRMRDTDNGLELKIEDSGAGIDPQQMPHVFEPFYTTKGTGTGLGLATVQRHVEAHRGGISVATSALGGAAFVIVLPRRPGVDGAFTDTRRSTRTDLKIQAL